MDTLLMWRARRGLSPGRLANKAGISYSTLRNAERGVKILPATAEKICKALDIDISDVSEFQYLKKE